MAFDTSIFSERLKEVTGVEPQDVIADRLNMTQGNVSKITTGKQLPKLDTIYQIAEEYDVSADWLLGLSDVKKRAKTIDRLSYAELVEDVLTAERYGAKVTENRQKHEVSVTIKDPLAHSLVKKARTLRDTDKEMFDGWTNTKLCLFADKEVIFASTWDEENLCFLADEASKESDWLQVHDEAKTTEERISEIMMPDPGPFDN